MLKVKKLKNIRKYLRKCVNSLPILILLGAPSFALESSSKSLIKSNPKEVIDEVWQIIYRDYLDSSGHYDPKEWISLRKKLLSNTYIDHEESYIVIKEMLANLKDPYTRFLDPSQFKEMRIDTSGELMGVGIQITLDDQTDNLVVVSPIQGTPADKAGIKPKDIIVSIDGRYTEGMGIEKAVKLIRGEKGSRVTLGIIRNEKLLKYTLIRERIEINSVQSALNKTTNGINIGYIRLKQFNANAPKEMSFAIRNLEKQNVLGYVLDLRGNPGGLLEASIEISKQWIDRGIIVSTKTRDGITDVRRANGNALTSKPVAILVNEGSASASEILSGAIRDNKRGFLVGKTTFGKGLVQSVRALSDGSGLTVTIAKYLTPNGIDINKNGLNPDIEANLSRTTSRKLSVLDLGTVKDNQYVIAETALVKKISKEMNRSTYNPNTSNIKFALN